MRYTRKEIRGWIHAIEDHSRARCGAVADRLRAHPALLAELRHRGDGPDRVFAALATGDFQMLRRQTFAPGWVSWIEGEPPYHWLMNHDRVMIDLTPAKRRGGRIIDSFADKYHCTPAQLARLIEALPDDVRINVRDDRIAGYGEDIAIDDMGEILSLSERFPDSFYRLQPVRERAFELLGIDFPGLVAAAEDRCGAYRKLYADRLDLVDAQPDPALRIVTRNGHWPAPGQLATRLAYYEAAKQLWRADSGIAPPPDPRVDEWIARGADSIDLGSLHQFKDVLARLYAAHHLYTAPLTGALGGVYAWLPDEMDWAAGQRAVRAPATHQRAEVAISTWLFALQAGLTRFGASLADSAPLPVWRAPNDAEWRSFLDRLPLNRHKLREGYAGLSATLENASTRLGRKKGRHYDHEESVDDLMALLSSLHKDCRNVRKTIGAVGGVALGVLGVSMPLLMPILGGLWGIAAARDALGDEAERLQELPNRLCRNRMDKLAIKTFVDRLDLPAGRPLA